MCKRTLSGLMFTLLLIGVLTLTVDIKQAKSEWTGTVYIRADGSIDPPDAPITTYDNIIYTLTDNITSSADGIVVERDNIVIDGAGYTMMGTIEHFYKGIDLSGRMNVTIQNTYIQNFSFGIRLDYSSNNSMIGNNITANFQGIFLTYSYNNSVIENNLINNSYGICLAYSTCNSISRNDIANSNQNGIELFMSSNNSITENNLSAGYHVYGGIYGGGVMLGRSCNNSIVGNFFINQGLYVEDSYGNVVEDNTVNGKPLVYFEGASDTSVMEAGQVILVSCNNIRVENLSLSNTIVGVQLWNTNNTIISGNNITNNDRGVYLEYSYNNSISRNNIANSGWEAIEIRHHSSNNSISRNNITNNCFGIECGGSFNVISGNNLTANRGTGIWLFGPPPFGSSNAVFGNNLTGNSIQLGDVYDNEIIGNTFINGGLRVSGTPHQNLVENNTVNGKPLVYLERVEDYSVEDAGQVILINCTGIRVENLNLSRTIVGVELYNTNDTIISGNNVTNNSDGILLYSSSNNSINRNNVTRNSMGISFYFSSHNVIFGNNITNNTLIGIDIRHSSLNNTICNNNIANNRGGIWLWNSYNNKFYHNNFINNTEHVFIQTSGYTNVWDNSYPSGGNYWSNYTGIDANRDAIGDTPHIIDANNIDNYPLMAPFSMFDAGVWNGVAYNVDVISNSTVSNFQLNTAQKTISFNVTGIEGDAGFCRVTIPNVIVEDLWQGNYTVLLNGEPWPFTNWTDNENTYIYVNYTHSEHQITIIPEYPSAVAMLLLLTVLLITIPVKRKLLKKSSPT